MLDKSKLKTNISLVIAPDPILSQVAKEVVVFDDKLKDLLEDMCFIMKSVDGLGLAAPQVNVSKRIFVIDTGLIETIDEDETKSEFIYIINPVVKRISAKNVNKNEGCLSLPDIFYDVNRPDAVEIDYVDENNKPHNLIAEDLLARCILHELDHLNGIIFTDHISKLKRTMAMAKLNKIKKKLYQMNSEGLVK